MYQTYMSLSRDGRDNWLRGLEIQELKAIWLGINDIPLPAFQILERVICFL